LGAAVLNLKTREISSVNGDVPLPLQSVFKLPLGIYVMHLAEQGKLALHDQVTFSKTDLSIFYSPITDAFDARQVYTVRELVTAGVSDSDNTAADWLLKRVGGPKALTRFFQSRGFHHFRVDRYEHELQPESVGLPLSSGRMTDADAYRRYRSEVPIEVRRAGMQRYLSDPRDRMSANDAVMLLARLDAGQLLTAAHTQELMKVLLATPAAPDRLKAGVPGGALVYHKTGTSADVESLNGATNDIGIIALPDGTRLAVAAFLSGSSLPADDRARVLASVAAAAARSHSRR
jgi:beta-lactamase class A